jgi:hypothetical protein
MKKVTKTIVSLAAFGTVCMASAQLPIGPFPPALGESFDTYAPGAYAGMMSFGGPAIISRIGTGGLLMVNANPAVLPPISAPNDLFGRGVDVRIRFKGVWQRFGGYFRVPNLGNPVNLMRVDFLFNGALVGSAIAPVNNLGWQWRGYDLLMPSFNEVRIFGNGLNPGYVGMENLRIG